MMIATLLPWVVLCSTAIGVVSNDLVAQINARTVDPSDPNGLNLFRDAMQAVGLLDGYLSNTTVEFTILAPSNAAIKASPEFQLYLHGSNETIPLWHYHLKEALQQHIVDGLYNDTDIFDLQTSEILSHHDPIAINQLDLLIQSGKIVEENIVATNGIIHVIDKVIKTKFMSESFAQLELQTEYGPDRLGRTAMTDIVDFTGARNVLNQIRNEGQTFIGCRIRAFQRLEEYLPQTIYGAPLVIPGEFLNETYKNETIANFIQYSLIPKSIYYEDVPDNFEELIFPENKCSHMWVTKRKGELCFNNGCVVHDEGPFRTFIASNGVGHVIDKCQVCHGVSMLVDVASKFTVYQVGDTAMFFRASEWNLRDLRQSVTNGTDVTLFASVDKGWSFFNNEDKVRLTTDEWKPHQWDLLLHMMVHGIHTEETLRARFEQEGPYNLTSLAHQPLRVDFDEATSQVTVEGGNLFKVDMKGYDGLVHFTTEVPLPISVTHTVYDIAKVNPNFATHILYIDSVQLDTDMKRLLPLTSLYAPNDSWKNKMTDMLDIADKVLKNHMFEKLMWCDKLLSMAESKEQLISLNTISWTITKNEKNMPCFEITGETSGKIMRACVTKCDILARNGIVHEIDVPLFLDTPETRSPSDVDVGTGTPPGGSSSGPPPSDVYQRPVPPADDSKSDSGSGLSFGGESDESGANPLFAATAILPLIWSIWNL